jgi:hypothetical protein
VTAPVLARPLSTQRQQGQPILQFERRHRARHRRYDIRHAFAGQLGYRNVERHKAVQPCLKCETGIEHEVLVHFDLDRDLASCEIGQRHESMRKIVVA